MSLDGGFRILVLADAHYDPSARQMQPDAKGRWCGFGCELLGRAIDDAKRRGGFDAVALMGDLLNYVPAGCAGRAVKQLVEQIRRGAEDVPLLLVAGNHDGPAARLYRAFGVRAGVHELGGYRFVVFCDPYEGDYCTRPDADRRLLDELAGQAGGPIVAIQHSPMNPAIEAEYPYMLTNREQVLADYSRAGVLLSLSGHYHAGQQLNEAGGVQYFTAPAICRGAFPYAVVTLRGPEVSIEQRQLAMPAGLGVVDCHAHTELAYCATDVTAEANIARARALGLAGICLIEHAPQLYVDAESFWSGEHVRRPELWRQGPSRTAELRQAMCPLRSDFVRIGLEVELDRQGQPILRDADRDIADVLVGAVHFLAEDVASLGDDGLAATFMRYSLGLLETGIDILAHPLRLFGWAGRPVPEHVPAQLAEELARADVAAEINFHHNQPNRQFLAECISQGVKVAFGSDAHRLGETANFAANLELLQSVAGRTDVSDLLWRWR